jgi:hypothetical protein
MSLAVKRDIHKAARAPGMIRYESTLKFTSLVILGDVRRKIMQRLSVVLHGSLESYLRYALLGG